MFKDDHNDRALGNITTKIVYKIVIIIKTKSLSLLKLAARFRTNRFNINYLFILIY